MEKKIKLYDQGEYEKVGLISKEEIIETSHAQPSNRVIEGSRDHGYAEEWIGYGHLVDGRKVKIVYLFDSDDLLNGDDDPIEDAGDYPWDTGLTQGRVILVD
jgi:hypothetical protein